MPSSTRANANQMAIVLILLVSFGGLAGIVWPAHGPLDIDLQVVALIAPFRGSALDLPMKVATYLCSWQAIVGGTVIAVVALGVSHRRREAVLLLIAVIGDEVIASSLKALIQRPRPDQALALLPAAGSSFPSGHTFICVTYYGLLAGLLVQRLRSPVARIAICFAAACWVMIVGVSRVYLGAHWPTDVAGSMLLGAAWIASLLVLNQALAAHEQNRRNES
jgi:undecaprenyl-diphosphatase